MDLELNRLSAVETPIHGEVLLADPDGSLARDGIRFPEPFRVEGSARMLRGQVIVAGDIQGQIELECGRCLCPLKQAVDIRFEARFAGANSAPGPSDIPVAGRSVISVTPSTIFPGRWIEDDDGIPGILLDREDLDVSFLPQGATLLRVEDIVREQVLLEVPIRPLCRLDCKGLCSRCGADLNLNDGGCRCLPEETHDLRLAGLAEIKRRLEHGTEVVPDTKKKTKKN